MKTQEFGESFKEVSVEIDREQQSNTNQIYIDDLVKTKGTLLVVPTFVPKKFIDQIQFVYTGGVYSLYIYINNSWKSVNLT